MRYANGNTKGLLRSIRATGHQRGEKFSWDAVVGKVSGR